MMFNIFLTLLFVCFAACDIKKAPIDPIPMCLIQNCDPYPIEPVCAVSEAVFEIFDNNCQRQNHICTTGKDWEVINAQNCIIALCHNCHYRKDHQCVLCGMASV